MKKRIQKALPIVLVFCMLVGITAGLLPIGLGGGIFALAGSSKSYQDQIDALDCENYNWTEDLFDYIQNDLLKRPAVICFSLGFKELQTTIGRACFTTIKEEDWSTIANTFDPEAQQIIDTQQ